MMRPKRDASQVRSYGIANAFCSAHCTTQYALKAFYAVHPERKPKT